jgi:YfiH family protein
MINAMTNATITAIQQIKPNWVVPQTVHAFCTTRVGGVSLHPYDSLNLGLNAGDDPALVLNNRSILGCTIPSEPQWLKQVHGITVSTPESRKLCGSGPFEADASVSNIPNEVLAVLAADCMPVLFASHGGDVIGVAHAGWRGLSGGVLENTLQAMCTLSPGLSPQEVSVWMGPAIGPSAFEVGEDVLQAFATQGPATIAQAFIPIPQKAGKYLANLYLLAQDRLRSLGIQHIHGGDFCTFSDQERFFSYRRDQKTGRFATLIWISPAS